MLNKDFAKIPDPDNIILNKDQKLLLKKYLMIRKKFPLNPTKTDKEEILSNLNIFFTSLDDIQRKINHNWFNYQLSCIDYKLLPCAKIAEFAIKHHLKDNLLISKDGESVMISFKDKDHAEQVYDKIKNFFHIEPVAKEII
jgi:hypothetical protein